MSLIPVTLSNATDTWVYQARSATNYSDGSYLRVAATASNVMYSYIYFPRPFPLGATVTSAIMHLRQTATLTGTRTVNIRRALQSWKVSRITYSGNPGQPNVNSAIDAAVTKTASVANTSWDFDLTAVMNLVSAGAGWYGVRIETTDTAQHGFWSSQASTYKPTFEVTWTDAPEAPSTLSPSGNRAVSVAAPIVRFDFTDHVGNTTLQAVRVQANATDVWTAPTFDTGSVLSSDPQLDLAGTWPRIVTVTTALTTTITAAAGTFLTSDVGAAISGTGIPAGATIATVAAGGASATMSAAGTIAGSTSATITEVFTALTSGGASIYWRVYVQDGAGVWSPPSLAAQFNRVTKGTLTITNPAASPNNFVSEATPPISWTFTGRTQTAHQVILANAAGGWIWHSGKLTSSATTYTLPAKLIHDGLTYNIIIRIWDTISRENTPGDSVWTEASRTFTYNLSTATAPVTAFTGTDLTPIPGIQLDWTRTTAPDTYTIVRDGKVIAANLIPSDLLVSGTAYRYIDRGSDPKIQHTWTARAVVNGITSASNPTVIKTLSPVGVWLSDPDTGIAVQLVGSDNGSWTNGEEAAIYTPVGGTRVVRVTQALRGFEGNITGTLLSFGTTNVQTMVSNMYRLKENAGRTYWLTFADMCIPVIIGNVTIAPVRGGEVRKAVSFDFWQAGDLPFATTL